jgi:hypothetical protein
LGLSPPPSSKGGLRPGPKRLGLFLPVFDFSFYSTHT